jgi:hypothetical protein
MWSTRYSCQSLMEFEFYRQIFEIKIPKCKIIWKSAQWEPSSMRTDIQARWRFHSLFKILRTRLKTYPDRIRGRCYLQAKTKAAIPTKVWVVISLNCFTVSGNQSPRIRACNFNTALATCEHKAITGVLRDAVCSLYQGVRYFQNEPSFASIREIRNVQ